MSQTTSESRTKRPGIVRLIGMLVVGGLLVGGALGFAQWWQAYQNDKVSERHTTMFREASDAMQRLEESHTNERERMRAMLQSGEFDLANLRVDATALRDAGPPKDATASLTMPASVSLGDVDFLKPDTRVLGVTHNGQSRAYPLSILTLHEAINDELAGTPIAVVFCPRCDSISVVSRQIDDETLEFGISGKLLNSNVLLYDRTHEGLWSQVGLEAISGPHAGRKLTHLDGWILTTFADWSTMHPDSTVLAPPAGYDLNYAMNPYKMYLASDQLIERFAPDQLDERLAAKQPVIGVRVGEVTHAYTIDHLLALDNATLDTTINDAPIMLRADPSSGRVEVARVADDAQVVRTFWFAWAAFHPQTKLFE